MHRYHFGPLRLTSSLELPELCPVGSDSASNGHQIVEPAETVTISITTRPLDPTFTATFADPTSAFELMLDESTDAAIMRHEQAVDFHISPGRDQIDIFATEAIASSTVRHYLLDQVLPRLLESRGHFVLHASGVKTDRGGILFLGQSGAGKSSLAAHMAGLGAQLLGDDCFVIDPTGSEVQATTTYPSLRLLPDSVDTLLNSDQITLSEVAEHRPKQRVNQSVHQPPMPCPVKAIFVIDLADHSGSGEIRPVQARHAILQLVSNSFRFHADAAAARRSLHAAEQILERVAVYDLRYERNYEQLDAVVDLVLSVDELAR